MTTRPARLLITGSRDWTDVRLLQMELRAAWHELRANFDSIVLVHGACPTGADTIAHKYWTEAGLPVETYPADWKRFGGAAGLIRNKHMVQLGADLCLAFPKGKSTGTRGCTREAEAAGIPTRTYEG